MPAVEMEHLVNPRQEIMGRVGDALDQIEVMGANVLCAIYKRPQKTASGLFVPDSVLDEDVFQGKVMLVLKLGPKAFQDDEFSSFTEAEKFRPGDWCVGRASDGWRITLNTLKSVGVSKDNLVDLRMFKDISLHMRVSHPDLLY